MLLRIVINRKEFTSKGGLRIRKNFVKDVGKTAHSKSETDTENRSDAKCSTQRFKKIMGGTQREREKNEREP